MKKKIIGAMLALLMTTACATSCGGGGGTPTSEPESITESTPGGGGATGGVISVPTAKNFNLDNAIADKDNWAGIEKDDYSLAMFNKGTPSYQINQDKDGNSVIYLSVLRSPSVGSYLYSPSEYTMTDYDGMRDCGNHHFSYAIKA